MNQQAQNEPETPGNNVSDRTITAQPPPPSVPDYELIRRIGGGAYGEVWLGRSTATGVLRAVKIVYRRTFDDERPYEREFEGIQRFERLSREHPGQLALFHVGRNAAAGCFYYVMELADDANPAGEKEGKWESEKEDGVSRSGSPSINPATYTPKTLRSLLLPPAHSPTCLPALKTRLPAARVLELGLALTEALAHLHGHGLVHRDVKPSNIIFVGGRPKLADIGLVTETGDSQSIVGTEGYLAPEGPGTPQADLYALGKVLYEAATELDRRQFPDLPPDLKSWPDARGVLELNEVLLKACARDAHQRYQSAAEMRDDLALLQRGQSVKRLRALERRVAILTRFGGVTAALLLAAAVAYLIAVSEARRTEKEKQNVEQLLYAADVNLAQQALEAGNLGRATALLEGHRPKPGRKDLRGFEWHYLKNLCRGDEAHTFHGHEQPVLGVAISSDGTLLASCSEDRTIQLWDLASQTNVATLREHTAAVNALAFSPDGTKLASGSADRTAKLWDVATRKVVAQFTNHADAVTSVALTPDGRLLAVGTEGTGAKLWNLASRQVVHEFTAADGPANLVAVSPDGQCLAIGGNGPGVRLWKLLTFQPLAELFDQRGFTLAMAFSPDSKFLAATRSDGIVLWDITEKPPHFIAKLKGHDREVHSVAFSTDGKMMASGSDDMTIRLWDFPSRQLVRIFKGHTDGVYSLVFSSGGQQFISGSLDHTLKLWDLSRKEEPYVLRGHADAVNCVAFSPDDRMVASAGLEGTVKLWDAGSGTNLATLTGHTAGVTGVEFSREAATLFSCGLDKTIRFWDVATRQPMAELPSEERLACLALSPDGRTLASGSGWWDQPKAPCVVTFWDVPSRRRSTRYVSAPGLIRTLSFSPDGRTLAIGRTGEESVELLDMASKHSVFFSTNLSPELAWSPDSRSLASPDSDFIAYLDIATARIVRRFQVPSASRSLTLSPDGKTLAVFRPTANIDLCNVVTGRKVATLQGHATFGFGLTFSHDGQTLASGSNDRTIRLWRAPTNESAVAQSEPAVGR